MSESPKTPGERAVWTAVFAATYVHLRQFHRSHGGPQTNDGMARDACDEAWGALNELRAIAADDADFSADAKAVIG